MCLVVNKCCFCVGLKPGALVLGYLNLVGSIFLASILHLLLSLLWALLDDHCCYIISVLFIVLTAFLVNFVLSFLLLYGIHGKKPKYVLSYLVAMPFMVGEACIIFICDIATGTSPTMFAISLTYILFQLYSLLIVRSHYLKMDKIESGPPILENV